MRNIGKLFQPDILILLLLAIFILGVQFGIKHGRELQIEDLKLMGILQGEYNY